MPAQVGAGPVAEREQYPNPEISAGEFPALWHRFRSAFLGEPEWPAGDPLIDFAGALLALKAGHHVTRDGWNGTGLFVMLQAGYPDGIPINANTSRATGLPQGTMCEVSPYLQLCRGGDRPRLDSWVPSVGDVLADDWRVLDRPGPVSHG